MIASRIRLLGRLSSVAALLLLLPLLGLSPASAHTALVSSDPADGAELTQAPTSVALTFTETMSADLSSASLRIAGNPAVKLPLSVGDSPEILLAEVPATVGSGKKWTVAYRVVSRDGHPVTGEVNFTVTAPATTESTSPEPTVSATPTATPEPEQTDAETSDEKSDDSSSAWWWTVGGIAAVVIIGVGVLAARANRRRARG
ncbi:copper resistance protein CopC [Nocardioides sp. Bht2]|uniref:copper resistance CopC family protein n=1 Tax=Nocardioides sp. Bht2 TaxID=3392297 RepID=UPI0039B6A371